MSAQKFYNAYTLGYQTAAAEAVTLENAEAQGGKDCIRDFRNLLRQGAGDLRTTVLMVRVAEVVATANVIEAAGGLSIGGDAE